MRGVVVGLLVATAFILSGCQYLLGAMMGVPVPMPGASFDPGVLGSFDPGVLGSFDPNDPAFSLPPPLATYTKGSATVTIDGKKTSLDSLNGTAAIYQDFGAEVGWTDGAGLYLRFYGEPGSPSGDGFVMLDRVVDGKHWTTVDPGATGAPAGCKVTTAESPEKKLSGTASCHGLRWVDAIGTGPLEQGPIAGQPPFDAEITFEATP